MNRKFSKEEVQIKTYVRSYLTLHTQPPAMAIPRKPATNANEDVEKEGVSYKRSSGLHSCPDLS